MLRGYTVTEHGPEEFEQVTLATSFSAFARARWGERWAICRNTAANRERWGRCITPSEYRRAELAYANE